MSLDWSEVFATGSSIGSTGGHDYATVAYGSTGAKPWVRRYNGPAGHDRQPTSLGVTPTDPRRS